MALNLREAGKTQKADPIIDVPRTTVETWEKKLTNEPVKVNISDVRVKIPKE